MRGDARKFATPGALLAALLAGVLACGCGSRYHVRTIEEPPKETAEVFVPPEFPTPLLPEPADPEVPAAGEVPGTGLSEADEAVPQGDAPPPAGDQETGPERVKVVVPEVEITPPHRVFKVGERLEFSVRWYFVKAGRAYMNVKSIRDYEGRKCYHLLTRATSRLLFFFKVNDWAETFTTHDKLLPLRFEKHIREGTYSKDLVATFDHDAGTSTWGGETAPMDSNCRDILSAFYYFRAMPLPPVGEQISLCANNNRKNYELVVNVLRREVVKVPAGEFRTVVIKPQLKFEGLFRQKGDIYIWLTDDVARIPVLVKSKVFLLGSVDVVLMKIKPGGM